MQKQSFAHLVATLGPLVGAAATFAGYCGRHHFIAYVACALLFWKRAAVEDVINSLQGVVSQTVVPQQAQPAPVAVQQSKVEQLSEQLTAELAADEAAANAATAKLNLGRNKVKALAQKVA